jgi:hypothetical protein
MVRVHERLRGSWYGPKLVKHVLRALWLKWLPGA